MKERRTTGKVFDFNELDEENVKESIDSQEVNDNGLYNLERNRKKK